MTKLKIKVFGENAEEIKDGQVFIAKKSSVEGRTVVTLEAAKDANDRLPFLADAIGEFIYTSLLQGSPVRAIKDILVESVEVVDDDFKRNEWR
jgi:hypothetical protein